MATTGQTEKQPKRTPRFDFSLLDNPTSMQTARKWAAERAVVELPLDDVIEDPNQPRTRFKEEKLQGLAKSIKRRGVMQPILVKEKGPSGKHVIIQGGRRYRASKIAEKKAIPAIIITETEAHLYDDFSQVIENIQRESLDPEEMFAFIVKHLAMGDKKSDIAEELGISPRDVSAYLSMQDLPENILELFRAGKIEGIEPLYALTRLRAKAPEQADRLIADAEQSELGEITLSMIRRANKATEEKPQATGPQSSEPGKSQNELTQSSSSASNPGQEVGEGQAPGNAATDGDDGQPEVTGSTATDPLTHEHMQDAQNIRPTEGDKNPENSNVAPNTAHAPYHNPAVHKPSGSGDGRKPDPDHIRKPLLLGEIDGAPVKVLLTRRPTSAGLVHISWEDTGIEEEVAIDRVKLTLLSEMKVQETA